MDMKNIETKDLSLWELSEDELLATEGGFLLELGIGLAVGLLIAYLTN